MSTADQWETATVRVEDIQHGDQISFGGVWLAVDRVSERGEVTDVIIPVRGELMMTTGTEVEVRKPADQDSVLAKVVAANIRETHHYGCEAPLVLLIIKTARAAGCRIERES